MTELNGRPEVARNEVILGQHTDVFQRIRPESPNMFLVSGLDSGTVVKIGDQEEVALFYLDGERQPFVPWKDSGQRAPQYFKLVDLPPMVRLMLSTVVEG